MRFDLRSRCLSGAVAELAESATIALWDVANAPIRSDRDETLAGLTPHKDPTDA